MKRTASLLFVALGVLCFTVLSASPALGHDFQVQASADCVNGIPVINYSVISWFIGGFGGSNGEIDILFDGVKVDGQALVFPTDIFYGQKPAPSATGTVTVEGVAIGDWDDGFPASQTPTSSVTVTIPNKCSPGTGRFTGGGKQVLVGIATLTKGFEVDCDLHQPSNNLEVNWMDPSAVAHHFHMETFDSAVCTLDGNPVPPKAPVNTIVASGTGRFDGNLGFTIQFTLIDNGEPGTSDKAGFMIFETANPLNVVLAFPLMTVTTGNIQAHVDQK